MLRASDGESFYFNHSYVLDVPDEYRLCVSRVDRPFVTGIRRGRTVGLQFHPEKSQAAGRVLLRDVIERLCDA
jgi:imidazoleglycerol phosphate synthase glutamine amidotransferase subunit HisH